MLLPTKYEVNFYVLTVVTFHILAAGGELWSNHYTPGELKGEEAIKMFKCN